MWFSISYKSNSSLHYEYPIIKEFGEERSIESGDNFLRIMASNEYFLLVTLLVSLSIFGFTFSEANQMVPAMYIFGDSLVDVGNNNHLKLSFSKADHFPYGIDFPHQIPTGRFSNGKNGADFLGKLFKILLMFL
jgi:hypothetical protein